MVTHITDTSKWEEWQKDYRLGLILILPPPEVSRWMNELRAKHDPYAYAICPAHISISDPLQREMTPALEQELRQVLGRIKPFRLYFDKLYVPPEWGGVYYPIRPQESIDELKEALHRASIFDGKIYRRRNIPAHMTIAEFIEIDESFKLCAELQDHAPSGSFLCDRLEFIVPDQEFHFQPCGTFMLGCGE